MTSFFVDNFSSTIYSSNYLNKVSALIHNNINLIIFGKYYYFLGILFLFKCFYLVILFRYLNFLCRPTKIFDYKEMAKRSTTKYVLSEYKSHVQKCIADASILMQIKWFESVEQLFKQVNCYFYYLYIIHILNK